MPIIVLDTNVLVSSMLNTKGAPGKILDLILDNLIRVAYDNRILGEYEDVLLRPELGLPPKRVLAIIDHIELAGKYIEAKALSTEGYPDEDDIVFAEVFVTATADALVTGNLRHYKPLLAQERLVQSPAQFLKMFFPTEEAG